MNLVISHLGSSLKPKKLTSMAKLASKCLFFLFFTLLFLLSSGTKVGFLYNARGKIEASSITRTLSVLDLNNLSSHVRVLAANYRVLSKLSNSNVSVHLYVEENLAEKFTDYESSTLLWLKTHVVTFMPHVNIKSIVVKASNDLSKVLSSMKLIRSVLTSFNLNNEVKVSVAFSLPLLENLNAKQEHDLHTILGFIMSIRSFVIVEDSPNDGVELSSRDLLFKSVIRRATIASSVLFCHDVDIVLIVKSSANPSRKQVPEIAAIFSELFENARISGQITELYADVSSVHGLSEKELWRDHEPVFPSARRELSKILKTMSREAINPPVTLPPDNPTPTIVTVPATNPVTVTPANPASTPVQIPSTTPVLLPPTNPAVVPPAPVTNPVTAPVAPVTDPITNPVTTYPTPPGNVPVTNPVTPPAVTNAPAIPGQSWCVAKSGVSETALQTALDYACGVGGADCSQIQQGGSCYNPITVQNHASYAFNSYYQKNPVATSCDFGGTASVVSSNPSTSSCVFPSSASSSSSPPASTSSVPTPPTPTNPATTPTPTNPATTPTSTNPTTTPSAPGAGEAGTGIPPSVLNSSSPGSGNTIFGSDPPPGVSTSTSKSASLQPSLGCCILVALYIARIVILDM